LNLPVNHQNDRVWSVAKKLDVDKSRLVVERTKFAKHVMVSAGACYGGKGRLHFIPDKAKVNGKLYCEILLTRLVEDCKSLLPSGSFSSRTKQLHIRRSWLKTGLPPTAVTASEKTNDHRTHQIDHVWGAILERYKTFQDIATQAKYH